MYGCVVHLGERVVVIVSAPGIGLSDKPTMGPVVGIEGPHGSIWAVHSRRAPDLLRAAIYAAPDACIMHFVTKFKQHTTAVYLT